MSGMDRASDDLLTLIVSHYNERPLLEGMGPNADDMLAALGAVTADQLISVCVSPANIRQSSRWIAGNEADDLLYLREADSLYVVVCSGALVAGLPYEELPNMNRIVQHASLGDALTVVPSLSVDDAYYPQDWPPNAAARFRTRVNVLLDGNGLKGEDRVITCAFATAKMIRAMSEHYSSPLTPLLIALETLAGCARMTPLQKEM